MKAQFLIEMPTPAGVKDEGFALYDFGDQRLKWSAPFPLPALGTRVYITMNNIGWASIEGFFAEDGYVGVMTGPKTRRSGCANSVSAISRTRGMRTSQIGGSKASAASLAPRSRWRSRYRDWSRRHDCPVCAAIQVAPALPRKLWPPNHHLLGMRTDTPSVRRRASPPGVQQLRQAASRSRR